MYPCFWYLPERRSCDDGRCVCRRNEDCGYGGWCAEGDCVYGSGFGSGGKSPPSAVTEEGTTTGGASSVAPSAPRDAGADASSLAGEASGAMPPIETSWR